MRGRSDEKYCSSKAIAAALVSQQARPQRTTTKPDRSRASAATKPRPGERSHTSALQKPRSASGRSRIRQIQNHAPVRRPNLHLHRQKPVQCQRIGAHLHPQNPAQVQRGVLKPHGSNFQIAHSRESGGVKNLCLVLYLDCA